MPFNRDHLRIWTSTKIGDKEFEKEIEVNADLTQSKRMEIIKATLGIEEEE